MPRWMRSTARDLYRPAGVAVVAASSIDGSFPACTYAHESSQTAKRQPSTRSCLRAARLLSARSGGSAMRPSGSLHPPFAAPKTGRSVKQLDYDRVRPTAAVLWIGPAIRHA